MRMSHSRCCWRIPLVDTLYLIELVMKTWHIIRDKINSIWQLSFRDCQSLHLFFFNRNIGLYPVCMDELANFTPAHVILHCLDPSDFHMHYLQRKMGGRAGLSKYSLPKVIIQNCKSSPVDEMSSCLCTGRGLHIQTLGPLFHFNTV